MRQGSVLAFDPLKAAVTGAQLYDPTTQTGSGGGLIGGNGTFYSRVSRLDSMWMATDILKLAGGALVGTLTVEIMNDDDNVDNLGAADWNTYTDVNGGGFVSGVAAVAAGLITGGSNPQPLQLKNMGFAAYRFKFVVSAGTGSIKDRRTLKGY